MIGKSIKFNGLTLKDEEETIEYISSLNLEVFRTLVNKKEFFPTIYDRIYLVILLSTDSNNLGKIKMLLKDIIDNNIEHILNDKYLCNFILREINKTEKSELLNCFLETFPIEHINIVLDNLFSSNFYLQDLLFTDYNRKIIEDYVTKCCIENDEFKLKKIFRVLYGNSSSTELMWIEFILNGINKENKLDCFLEYYKDLFEKKDRFVTVNDKEKLISLLLSLMNVISKDDNNDNEFVLKNFMDELFKKLSSNTTEDIFPDASMKLVTYMNDLVGSHLEDTSKISDKLLKNPVLIKYLLPIKIVTYGMNRFVWKMGDSTDETISSDDTEKVILNDEINFNLIKNLSSSILIEFFLFSELDGENTKTEDIIIIKEILRRYFPYEKAIIFVEKLKINDIKKRELINDVYPEKNVDNINLEKERIISRLKNELLNSCEQVSDEFKSLLPDLIELPYDDELFNKLKKESLKINKLEYLFVFLSQYFKFGCNVKNMNYTEYTIEFIPRYCRIGGSANGQGVKVYYDDYEEKDSAIWQNVEYREIVNHERTHLGEKKLAMIISMDALMISLETQLIFDRDYYNENYRQVYTEIHARMVSFYETYIDLKEIDPKIASKYLKRNKYLIVEKEELLEKKKVELTALWNDVANFGESSIGEERNLTKLDEEIKNLEQKLADMDNFIRDRKKAQSVEYFANLINLFLEDVMLDEFIYLRNSVKTLELITAEDGRLYSVDEIEKKINTIKSYSTNDIEFSVRDRDIKVFYTKYLSYLRCAIENNLINIERFNKGIRNNSHITLI